MTSLLSITLAAILSLPRPPTEARAEQLAGAIASAVADAAEDNPFAGPARHDAAALMLVAIAWHESGLDERVEDCRLTGDRSPGQAPHAGPSITLWQLRGPWAWGRYSRGELCGSSRLAGAQAIRVLRRHADRCTRGGPGAWVAGYASGSCGRPTRAARVRCATWQRLAARAGLRGAVCDVRREISWSKPS